VYIIIVGKRAGSNVNRSNESENVEAHRQGTGNPKNRRPLGRQILPKVVRHLMKVLLN